LPRDWDRLRDETVAHLQRLLQFDTINPPGNERPLAQYLTDALQRENIASTVLTAADNRDTVVATLPGTGEHAPVMLVAHMDVVGVEAEQWTFPPLGGEIHDGYIYGRGAIDDKGMLAVNLVTMLTLAREYRETGRRLARDVIFLATPDEETGGRMGMGWLMTHHPDILQRAEYAINEGGRVRIAPDGSKTLFLQVAEKVSHLVTMAAHGHPGHAGVPRADNAILCLGRALAKISDYAADPQHGVSPTILQGGVKYNVIPSEASVVMNIRTRPGESVDRVVADLAQLVDDANVTLTITERGTEAPASPVDSEMYEAMAAAARALDPAITVTPYVSNGITDSARLRQLGIKAYGVLPFPLIPDDESRMHGHDERVPVESVGFGLQLILDSVERICTIY
jgi:acetylornithine deacetylase/succinyl-diaminopimelate desuccinylase-like protein